MAGSTHAPGSFPYRAEQAFNRFAIAEGGSHKVLPVAAVHNALFELELNPSAARVSSALANDGYSKRGLLLSDFHRLSSGFLATYASLNEMIGHFQTLDTDKDDKISRGQFASFVGGLPPGDRIVGRSFDDVMETLDPHNTGYIYLRSFLKSLFPDFTDEEIFAAMLENGFDPEREDRDMRALAEKAASEAQRRFDEGYEALMAEERLLRTEISAEQREASDTTLNDQFEDISEMLAEAASAREHALEEAEAADRAKREREAADLAEQERVKAEADRKAAEEKERAKAEERANAAEAEQKRKVAEAEKKRAEEEKKPSEPASQKPPPTKKNDSSCCVVM